VATTNGSGGGGGGGGLFGGGGGSAGSRFQAGLADISRTAAGGGGGSSLVPAGCRVRAAAGVRAGDGRVVVVFRKRRPRGC
jgi:hypothetical protein